MFPHNMNPRLANAMSIANQTHDNEEFGMVELQQADLCYIDPETSRVLELLENNVDVSNKKHSLLGYLDTNTCTTTGTRLLREGIMKPICHLTTLEHRLDCVDYLVKRIDTLSNITNSIRKFGSGIDLEAVIPVLINLLKNQSETLHMAEKRLDALTTVETLMSQIIVLVAALEGTDQPMLNIYKTALEDPAYNEILESIHEAIEPSVRAGRNKRGKMYRIKQGIESLFDIARSTYSSAIADLEVYVNELNKQDGLNWKLSHSESRGYFLSLSTDRLPKKFNLPPKYIRVNKTRSLITCTTQEMMQSNVRANISYENSMKLANEILKAVLSSITEKMIALYKMVDIVGMLDLMTAFAKLVINSNGSLVRPKFTATETIISKARHPILESTLAVNNVAVIPNDVVLSANHKNLMLVTGPNMGGKSIYLKQIALIQIMAQMGCFIPAESGHIKLMRRIVARSGTSDDIESTCSSFMWEMKGIATALLEDKTDIQQNVLYIIDEVGRGTTIDDGASYSFAIAEELALRRNCFTIFATHFDQVFALTLLYGNVVAYHFKYEESVDDEGNPKLKITHHLSPGMVEKNNYGIRLAEACGLPAEIIEIARKDLSMKHEV